MEEYILYATKNIFQIRKSQEDIKIDIDLQDIIKNATIETNIFMDNNSNTNIIKEDIEEENKKILELLIADSYSNVVAMTCMH